jgi:hypothetical protein
MPRVYVKDQVGKMIKYPYDDLLNVIGGNGSCLYCLSDRTVMLLLASTEFMGWVTRYYSDLGTAIDKATVEEWRNTAIAELMTCFDTNTNQIIIQQQQNILIHNQYQYQYDGTIGSININAPTDFFNGDGSAERDNALCMALKDYIVGYVRNAIEHDIVVGFLVGAVGATLLALLTGGIGLIAGFLFIGATGALSGLVSGWDELQWSQYVDDLTCCMFDYLKGKVINQANFGLACTDCIDPGSPQGQLAQEIAYGLSANYLSFLDALGNAYLLAQAGVNDCPCVDEWCFAYDFTDAGQHDWENEQAYTGVPVFGFGWRSQQLPTNNRHWIIISLNEAFSNATEAKIYYTAPYALLIETRDVATNTNQTANVGAGAGTDQVATIPLSGENWNNWMFYAWSPTNQPVGNYWYIHKIEFRGTGVNPFGISNC